MEQTQSKYYTPSASDFYCGYKYEKLAYPLNQVPQVWKEVIAGTEDTECGVLDQCTYRDGECTNYQIEEGVVRTKFLKQLDK